MAPVIVKELRATSWRWQSYAGRGVYVGLVGLIVFGFWIAKSRGGYLSPSEYAQLGRELFNLFLGINLALVSLASIMVTADMVTREVRTGTLALLIASPLGTLRIALGKWLAAMAHCACLVLCGMPVAATCLYLGGVGYLEVVVCFTMTLSMAGIGSAMALWSSARQATAERAILHAVLWLVGYAVAPLAVVCIGAWPLIFVAPFAHPLYAVVAAVAWPGKIVNWAWLVAVPSAAATAFVFLRMAARRLEERVGSAERPADLDQDVLSRRGITDLWRRKDPSSGPSHVWEDRPLLWKELATRAAGRLSKKAKIWGAVYFALVVLAAYLVSRGGLGAYRFVEFLFLLFAVVFGSTLFAREKQGRALDLLLVTPLPPADLVRTKLASGLLAPEGAIVAGMWLLCAILWGLSLGPVALAAHVLDSGVFLVFAYVLAATASLRARTLYAAALASAGVLVFLGVVLPFALATLESASAWGVALQRLGAVLHPGRAAEAAAAGHWWAPLAFAGVYAGAIALMTAGMVRHLGHYPERG